MSVKALRLNCFGAKEAMRHPLLAGKKPIGRGVFSAVFEGTKIGRVLKMTVDDIGYWLFNDRVAAVSHRHFPRITNDFGIIGEVVVDRQCLPIFLYEMERLEKLSDLSPAKRLARLMVTKSSKTWSKYCFRAEGATIAELQDLTRDNSIPRSVKNALRQLEDFCHNFPNASLDMHMGNFMERKNGDLVLIDPLANMGIWQSAQKATFREGMVNHPTSD